MKDEAHFPPAGPASREHLSMMPTYKDTYNPHNLAPNLRKCLHLMTNWETYGRIPYFMSDEEIFKVVLTAHTC